jgi:NADPH:quinone reductase-like Zn-dependent oxidoreductase
MKAAFFSEHGDSSKLIVGEIEPKPLLDMQIKIKVKYAALNRLDIYTRNGNPKLKIPLPHIGGSDVVGEVVEVGENVSESVIGKNVVVYPVLFCKTCEFCLEGEHSLCYSFSMIGEHQWGGFAEYIVVPSDNYHILPDNSDLKSICSMSLTTMTAWRMLKSKAQLKKDQTILVLGAGGGLSSTAIQISKLIGATVIATTGSDEKLKYVKQLGADHVLNYSTNPEWSKEVWEITEKKGVDVVFESTGEKTWESSLRSLKKGGKLVTAGATTGFNGKTNIGLVFWKQLEILGSTMASISEFHEAINLIQTNKIKPNIDKIYSLDEIKQAYDHLESGKHKGKVLIKF